ncbi:hypothetical protein HN446_03495 [bacterium]|nr:hypothetical protein [bacterium]
MKRIVNILSFAAVFFIGGLLLKPYLLPRISVPSTLDLKGQTIEIEDTYTKPQIMFHGSPNKDIKVFGADETMKKSTKFPESPSVFATPHIGYAACYLFDWGNLWYHQVSFDMGPWIVACNDKETFMKNDKGGTIYVLPSKSFYTNFNGWIASEWASKEEMKPIHKMDFDSSLKTMLSFGVQVFFVDEETTEAIKKSTDNGREILMKLEKAGESENTKLGINPMPLFDYKAEALKTQY